MRRACGCGGHAGQLLAAEITAEPVLVTRDKSGVLRAFANVCRHRGSLLAEGQGAASVIRCPYHAWTYGLDGSLLGQPEFDGVQDWDRSSVCLPQYCAEVWGPFFFLIFFAGAAPFAEVLGAIPQEIGAIGCPFERLRFSYCPIT